MSGSRWGVALRGVPPFFLKRTKHRMGMAKRSSGSPKFGETFVADYGTCCHVLHTRTLKNVTVYDRSARADLPREKR